MSTMLCLQHLMGRVTMSAHSRLSILKFVQRPMSASTSVHITQATMEKMTNERNAFHDTFPMFVDVVTKFAKNEPDLKPVSNHLTNILNYTVRAGSLVAGLLTVGAARLIRAHPEEITDEELFHSYMLGWCTQMYVMIVLISDDLVDNGNRRQGQEPWFRKEGVGMNAVNDCLLMLYALNNTLSNLFRHKSCYVGVMEDFNSKGFLVAAGQTLDCNVHKSPLMDRLTMDAYKSTIKYKSMAFTQAYVDAGIRLNCIKDPEVYKSSRELCGQLGHMIQIGNDIGDQCHSWGTDIVEGKRTWLAAKMLELANNEQRNIIKENYGVPDEACKQRVLDISNDLNIKEHAEHEMENIIQGILKKIPMWKLPPEFCHYALNHALRFLDIYSTRGN